MFVFTKGRLGVFNPIKDRPNKSFGRVNVGTIRLADGSVKRMSNEGKPIAEYGQRFNVWEMSAEMSRTIKHPAPFPEAIARDHILSWSNPGDTVLDPFLGSGTTGKMAKQLERSFIGIEISQEYFNLAKERIESTQLPILVTNDGWIGAK
jgi:site-specific DNA-methyltransferase (adenine-specific)